MSKLRQRGWIDNENDKVNNIPDKCPICGGELWITNALQTSYPVIFICCKNSKCRYCEEFTNG